MLRIYDEFLEDETVLGLKPLAYKLHVSALIYCSRNLTDGEVSERAVKVLQAILDYQVRKFVTELVDVGLWVPSDDDGYRIRNYLEFNPDASTVKKERAKGRDRMRKLREKRASDDERAPARDGVRDAARDGAAPALPSPDLSNSTAQAGLMSIEEGIKRLVVATGVRSRTDVDKITRTIVANHCTVGAIKLAIVAATGPGVRDPLAVALSELKKRRAA